MKDVTNSFFTAALADYIVLNTLELLPSLTDGAGTASDEALQSDLSYHFKNKLITTASPAGNQFTTLVGLLDDAAPEVQSAEEAFGMLPTLINSDDYLRYEIQSVVEGLATLTQTSFEGMSALSEKAEEIVRKVESAGQDAKMTQLDPDKRTLDEIDLGAADDADIVSDAAVVASDFFSVTMRDTLLEMTANAFDQRGRTLPYTTMKREFTDDLHNALDRADIQCPRESMVSLFTLEGTRGILFPKVAYQDKDEFVSGSRFVRGLWLTLNSMLENEEAEESSDIVLAQARSLRNLTAVSILFYASLLNRNYRDMVVFNYDDRTIYTSPVGYGLLQNRLEDAEESVKLFVELKDHSGKTVPNRGWGVTEIVQSAEKNHAERRALDTKLLEQADRRKLDAERAMIDAELRRAVPDGKVERLHDKAREAYRSAMLNDERIGDHVLDFLVHSINHPALTAYMDTTRHVAGSNEDLATVKAQGTFNAVSALFLSSLIH